MRNNHIFNQKYTKIPTFISIKIKAFIFRPKLNAFRKLKKVSS